MSDAAARGKDVLEKKMRRTVLLLVLTGLLGCDQQREAAPQPAADQIRTVDNTPIRSIPVQPPPTVVQQEAAPKLRGRDQDDAQMKKALEESLLKRVELPFAPAIAMDPVDGSKVSIRSDTPIAEYKDKLYYFSTEGNKRTFMANPEAHLKGGLSRY